MLLKALVKIVYLPVAEYRRLVVNRKQIHMEWFLKRLELNMGPAFSLGIQPRSSIVIIASPLRIRDAHGMSLRLGFYFPIRC